MPIMPILRLLTPETLPLAPSGFTLVDERPTRGLPHRVILDGTFSLILVAPTGVATAWRDANPAEVISQAIDERNARSVPGIGAALPNVSIIRYPLRLLLLRNGDFLGSVPLVAGLRRYLPETHESIGAGIDLIILDWTVPAGSLRGLGDFGARLLLAWRLL
jgi:hypothetical protein